MGAQLLSGPDRCCQARVGEVGGNARRNPRMGHWWSECMRAMLKRNTLKHLGVKQAFMRAILAVWLLPQTKHRRACGMHVACMAASIKPVPRTAPNTLLSALAAGTHMAVTGIVLRPQ